LAGATTRYSMDWLIAFTRNSAKVIMSGDVKATLLYNQYQKTQMQGSRLSNNEIKALFSYIDNVNGRQPSYMRGANQCYSSSSNRHTTLTK